MEETQLELRKLVRSAKHPAVVGWIVGNELNGPWNLYGVIASWRKILELVDVSLKIRLKS